MSDHHYNPPYPPHTQGEDIQFIRMLHSETQRQLSKVTETLTTIESRINELEHLKDYREGQVSISKGLGGMAFKVGLVVLAFAMGVWGSSFYPTPCDRQRSPENPYELHAPYPRRPTEEPEYE